MKEHVNHPRLISFKEVESTNLTLKQLNETEPLPEFSVVMARKQTAGRGQNQTRWESEEGKNLTFSFIIRPYFLNGSELFRINQVVTLAMVDLLKPIINDVSIKWPNDIYAGSKKLAGILIENNLLGSNISYSIIGIGLNVNQENFVSDAPNPVSLYQLTGKCHDVELMMKSYMSCFMARYNHWLDNGDVTLENDYYTNLFRGTGFYKYRDKTGEFEASIAAVEPDGHLVLKTVAGANRRYAFKEVIFIL